MLINFDEPLIIMMMGFSGTGKSYTARNIAKINGYLILSTDRIRKNSGLTGNYSKDTINSVYKEMIKTATELLRKGRSVILDATFSKYRYRKFCYENAGAVPIHLIECRVHKEETILKRLRIRKIRKTSISEADVNVFRQQQIRYEPIGPNDFKHLKSMLIIFND